MRKIYYIFIDSDRETHDNESDHNDVPGFRYHYIVNSKGGVINTTDTQYPVSLIQGPIYDREKYNKCSIYIRYCGFIRTEAWILEPETSCTAAQRQRTALLQLLVKLRKHFPDAKILGLSELDGREFHHKNIIVSDAMNVLRSELSDLP